MRFAAERLPKVALNELQEHDMGTKRNWSGMRGEDGEEILLGSDMVRRLRLKRSPTEARSRKSGEVAL